MKPLCNITKKIVALVASISEKIGEINATHLYKPATELFMNLNLFIPL